MKKSLTMICAVALTAGVAACGRGGSDEDARLNNAATILDDNGVFDTSADDAAAPPADDAAPANGAAANGAAPAGNSAAGNGQ